MKKFVIAIDGPAGSGKSTVAKLVAEALSFMYIDTGAMYRALTLKAINENISLTDKKKLVDMARDTSIEFCEENSKNKVLLDGKDVSDAIRSEKVGKYTRYLASIRGIREILWNIQREYRKKHNIVMEGRDIGSKVFPDAQVKVFLDASVEERAKRRFLQLQEMGVEAEKDKIEAEIKKRDKNDTERTIAPLKKLPDAVVIDTTGMTIQQVTDQIIFLVPEYMR